MAYKLVGYFENWAQYRQAGGRFLPDQIDPTLFTHINFAFGLFGFVTWSVDPTETRTGDQRYTGDYTIQPVESNDQTELYPALQKLKGINPALKTLLSIGGWSINSGDDKPSSGNQHPYGPFTYHLFSRMAADAQGQAQFISSAIAYAQKNGFDGIDIDWEYPGYLSRGGTPEDLPNFLSLVREFRAKAPAGFLLTMAAPAIVPTGVPEQYHHDPDSYFSWLAQCAQSVDWLNVMCYDYHGAFDDPAKGTGVNAPLLQDSTMNGPFSLKHTVEAYLKAGIPKDKIVLGMPTYGRSFLLAASPTAPTNGYRQPFTNAGPAGAATAVPGVLAYYEILAQLGSGELIAAWDDATLTPYAYSRSGNSWVSYDDAKSLAYKTSYVIEQGLAGAMIWSIDDDVFSSATAFPLVHSVKAILDNPATRPALPAGAVDSNAQALADAIKNNQSLGNARASALFVLFFACGAQNVDPATFVKNNKVSDVADANSKGTFQLAAQTFAILNPVSASKAFALHAVARINASDESVLGRFRNRIECRLGKRYQQSPHRPGMGQLSICRRSQATRILLGRVPVALRAVRRSGDQKSGQWCRANGDCIPLRWAHFAEAGTGYCRRWKRRRHLAGAARRPATGWFYTGRNQLSIIERAEWEACFHAAGSPRRRRAK
jgi:chitinase